MAKKKGMKGMNIVPWIIGGVVLIAIGVILYVVLKKPSSSPPAGPPVQPPGGSGVPPGGDGGNGGNGGNGLFFGTNGGNGPPPRGNLPPDQPVDSGSWVSAHNQYRAKAWPTNTPLLSWNSTLAQLAQQRADSMNASGVFSEGDPITSPGICHGSHCGVNLEMAQGGPGSTAAVGHWYGECPLYTGGFSEAAGHFTQVVWRGTKEVGCGVSGPMVVCVYDAGNIAGEFSTNVPPPGKDC